MCRSSGVQQGRCLCCAHGNAACLSSLCDAMQAASVNSKAHANPQAHPQGELWCQISRCAYGRCTYGISSPVCLWVAVAPERARAGEIIGNHTHQQNARQRTLRRSLHFRLGWPWGSDAEPGAESERARACFVRNFSRAGASPAHRRRNRARLLFFHDRFAVILQKTHFPPQILNKILKSQEKYIISYHSHRNFLESQIVKNLLRKWSRFCKDIV